MRCRHRGKWVDVQSEHFDPQPLRRFKSEGGEENLALLHRLIEGYTIVTQRCARCGALRSVELRGHVETTIEQGLWAVEPP